MPPTSDRIAALPEAERLVANGELRRVWFGDDPFHECYRVVGTCVPDCFNLFRGSLFMWSGSLLECAEVIAKNRARYGLLAMACPHEAIAKRA